MATAEDSTEPRYRNEDWLREQYVEEGLTQREIGELCGVSHQTISEWLDRFEIDTGYTQKKHYESLEEALWDRVDKRGPNSCWLWDGATVHAGHGIFGLNGSTYLAHRTSFILEHGHEPENNVLHVCDNPPCVNPEHLYDGTLKQNMRDARVRGDWDPTDCGPKLSEDDVLQILERYEENDELTRNDVADEFGVSAVTVSSILNGHTHSDITDIEPDD